MNIRVGEFGEVQVLDWGLGKVLSGDAPNLSAPPVKDDAIQGRESSTVVEVQKAPTASLRAHSHEGEVRGTFHYMPPEQARGEVLRVDKRCDVFGLGAILCEMLTGEPPYAGSTQIALWEQARKAQLAPALSRLDASGADAKLVELTKRCLAAEPEGRPADAGAVAEEVTAYLHGVQEKLRQSELAQAEAEARATEERRRRRTQLVLGGVVLAAVLAGLCGWWLVERRQQQRRTKAIREIQETLTKGKDLLQRASALPMLSIAEVEAALAVWKQGDERRSRLHAHLALPHQHL